MEEKTKLAQVWGDYLKKFKKTSFDIRDYDKDIFYNWIKNQDTKGKAMDQGAGIGFYTKMLEYLGYKTIGVEISGRLIKEALKEKEKLNMNYKMVLGDIRNLPFTKESFDLILSGGIVEHFPETQKALDESYRVLKRGGTLLIHVPNKVSFYTITKLIQQISGKWDVGYEKSFTPWKFCKMLNKAGFKIKKKKIKKVEKGKSKLVYYIINILNYPLDKIGLGGHHMFFYCTKD